jgi:hypothetical protein
MKAALKALALLVCVVVAVGVVMFVWIGARGVSAKETPAHHVQERR